MIVKMKRTKKLRSEVDEQFETYETRKQASKRRSLDRDSNRKSKYNLQFSDNEQ